MKIPKQERIKEVVRLLGFGYNFKQISNMLKVSQSTILLILEKLEMNDNSQVKSIN